MLPFLLFKAAEQSAMVILPETLHVFESGAAKPLHLVVNRRLVPIEIQKATAGLNQRVGIIVDSADDLWTIHVVNGDRGNDGGKAAPASACSNRDG